MQQSLVYILVLNWNGWNDTIACLESLKGLDYNPFKVIIIDNASTDDSFAKIENWINKEQLDEKFLLIQSGTNLGYSGGNNFGIKYVLASCDFEYLWLLNNDIIVDKIGLSKLVRMAEGHLHPGMIGSKVMSFTNPERLQTAGGGIINPIFGTVKQIGNNEQDYGQWDHEVQLDYITGASLFIRREVIQDIGLLNEDYFMYSEDIDWSIRCKRSGWNLAYCPESVVWHKEGATAGFRSTFSDYYSSRNTLQLIRSYYKKQLFTAFCISLFGKIVNRIRRKQFRNIYFIIKAYIDFLVGKAGEVHFKKGRMQ